MLAYELFISKAPNYDEANLEFGLRSLRLWASHPDIKGSDPAVAADITPTNSSSKTSLWRAYYDLLSIVLQNDLQYPPMSDAPKRVQLSTEFRRIEATCENVLLRHSKFPKANVSNQEVELWVKQVIHNWEVFCSAEWCDDDFGEGGQGAISRNVLDVSSSLCMEYMKKSITDAIVDIISRCNQDVSLHVNPQRTFSRACSSGRV